jgi:hypothetical protein
MKTFPLLSACIFSVLLISGCKKDDPAPTESSPVFHANGLLDNSSFDLKAGVNGYYMYSSFNSDAYDTYEFTGELKKQGCNSPCAESFTVRIRDYATHTSQQTDIMTALAPGFYNFLTGQPQISDSISFDSYVGGDTLGTYMWTFGDNSAPSNLPDPVHGYAAPGMYPVMVYIIGAIYSDTLIDTLHVGMSRCMDVDFTATQLLGDSVLLNVSVTGGTPPYSYAWAFGDGTHLTTSSPVYTYAYPPGVYTARVEVTDAVGCTQVKRRNVRSASTINTMINFNWQPIGTNLGFSKVVVEWVDAAGNIYTSQNSAQPTTSTFEIVSVENYEPNENGQQTKKIHMRISCMLYSSTGSIQLQNADVIFAVAHP